MAWTVLRTVTDSVSYVAAADHNETKANFDIVGGTDGATKTGNWYVSGNVGIGTTSPGRLLQVAASASASGIIRITSNAQAANGIEIGHGYASGTDNIAWILNRANADFALGTNNAENIRITASGNVGIGTSSPVAGDKLTITGGRFRLNTDSAYNAPIIMSNDTGVSDNLIIKMYSPQGVNSFAPWYIRAGVAGVDGAAFAIQTGTAANIGSETVSTKLFINTAGNVGIATTSPQANLHVTSGGFNVGYFTNGTFASSSNSTLLIGGGDAGLGAWENVFLAIHKYGSTAGIGSSSSLSRLRFDATSVMTTTDNGSSVLWSGSGGTYAGRVGIGTSSPGYQLTLSTDSAAKPTSNTWTISSDARVKEVIGSYTRGVADIMALEPKRYRLNGAFGSVDDGRVHVSVVAQEAQATWPEMIGTYDHTDKDEDDVETVTELLNLNTNELQWALVNAIKELSQRVEALEA